MPAITGPETDDQLLGRTFRLIDSAEESVTKALQNIQDSPKDTDSIALQVSVAASAFRGLSQTFESEYVRQRAQLSPDPRDLTMADCLRVLAEQLKSGKDYISEVQGELQAAAIYIKGWKALPGLGKFSFSE